jgi:chromate transporter
MQTTPVQDIVTPPIRPGTWHIFLIWTGIGLQSFGGGASTIFLIQREFIEKRHWLTMEEFTHFWSLCVLVPGITLMAMAILIGRKLGGVAGIVSALLGMLVPSVLITCIITALFQGIKSIPVAQAVVKGVIPATAGIMLLVGIRFAQPQLKEARQTGPIHVVVYLAFILSGIVGIILMHIPIIFLLPCIGLLSLVIFTYVLPEKKKGA